MATKKQIKKLLKSKKLSGRESAALIIENQVALETGNKPTLTRDEIEAIKLGLIDRNHEGIEYNALLETYQLAGYIIREASIDALEAIECLETIRSLAAENLQESFIRSYIKHLPDVFTQEEYDQKYAEALEQKLESHWALESFIIDIAWKNVPGEIREDADEIEVILEEEPQYVEQAINTLIQWIREGSLTVRKLPNKKLAKLKRLRSELDQLKKPSSHAEKKIKDQAYDAWNNYTIQIEDEAMPEADQEEVIDLLSSITDLDDDSLEGFYCQNRELCNLSESFKNLIDDIVQGLTSHFFTVIVKEDALNRDAERFNVNKIDHLKRVIQNLRDFPSMVQIFIDSFEDGEVSFEEYLSMNISKVTTYLKRFYASKIALDELSALLQIEIAPTLKGYEKRVINKIEVYNRLAKNDTELQEADNPLERIGKTYSISEYTPLLEIDLEELKPSEEQIQRYRDNLTQYLGDNWIIEALSILREEKQAEDLNEVVEVESSNHA